jgi:hypothetical protein
MRWRCGLLLIGAFVVTSAAPALAQTYAGGAPPRVASVESGAVAAASSPAAIVAGTSQTPSAPAQQASRTPSAPVRGLPVTGSDVTVLLLVGVMCLGVGIAAHGAAGRRTAQ